jgi:hypothetical protein
MPVPTGNRTLDVQPAASYFTELPRFLSLLDSIFIRECRKINLIKSVNISLSENSVGHTNRPNDCEAQVAPVSDHHALCVLHLSTRWSSADSSSGRFTQRKSIQ